MINGHGVQYCGTRCPMCGGRCVADTLLWNAGLRGLNNSRQVTLSGACVIQVKVGLHARIYGESKHINAVLCRVSESARLHELGQESALTKSFVVFPCPFIGVTINQAIDGFGAQLRPSCESLPRSEYDKFSLPAVVRHCLKERGFRCFEIASLDQSMDWRSRFTHHRDASEMD